MSTVASQITSLTIVYSTVYSAADQRKHQSSASLSFVRGIYRGPVNSPHKWPVTRKMCPFDDVITLSRKTRCAEAWLIVGLWREVTGLDFLWRFMVSQDMLQHSTRWPIQLLNSWTLKPGTNKTRNDKTRSCWNICIEYGSIRRRQSVPGTWVS